MFCNTAVDVSAKVINFLLITTLNKYGLLRFLLLMSLLYNKTDKAVIYRLCFRLVQKVCCKGNQFFANHNARL